MSDFVNAGWATEGFARPSKDKLAVVFHRMQFKDEFQSRQQNRPVYREKIMITKIPADQYNRPTRPMRETDKDEFPAEWAQFERTGESRVLGFSIEHWHALNDTQKAEFKAMNLQTVEQIAGLSDGFCQGKMGLADLRKKAQVFLEAGKDAELVAQMKAENDKIRAEMAEMKAMLEAVTTPAGKK